MKDGVGCCGGSGSACRWQQPSVPQPPVGSPIADGTCRWQQPPPCSCEVHRAGSCLSRSIWRTRHRRARTASRATPVACTIGSTSMSVATAPSTAPSGSPAALPSPKPALNAACNAASSPAAVPSRKPRVANVRSRRAHSHEATFAANGVSGLLSSSQSTILADRTSRSNSKVLCTPENHVSRQTNAATLFLRKHVCTPLCFSSSSRAACTGKCPPPQRLLTWQICWRSLTFLRRHQRKGLASAPRAP